MNAGKIYITARRSLNTGTYALLTLISTYSFTIYSRLSWGQLLTTKVASVLHSPEYLLENNSAIDKISDYNG